MAVQKWKKISLACQWLTFCHKKRNIIKYVEATAVVVPIFFVKTRWIRESKTWVRAGESPASGRGRGCAQAWL